MMFEYAFKLDDESSLIKKAVEKSITEGIVNEDISIVGKSFNTSEVGDWISNFIKNKQIRIG